MEPRETDDVLTPGVSITAFFPRNFFNKSVNEPFIQQIMQIVLGSKDWRPGNADKFEPDYFCDGIPFEFTIASNRKKKGNHIQELRSGTYTSEDVEQDVIQYIRESVQQKLEKKYSVHNVHLCVLCLIDFTQWVLGEYGSETQYLLDQSRTSLFDWIRERCINTEKFSNVFVTFPDAEAKWWAWDVRTGHKASVQLSDENILSQKVPFCLTSEAYKGLKKQAVSNDKED